MAYTIEAIEDALLTALDPLKTSLDVRAVKTYQGELAEEDVRKIVTLCPAVYVMYGGSEYQEHGARKVELVTFHLFVCDKSLRTEDEARRGGTQNPGTYAMLSAIRDLLCGKRLSLEIYPLRLVREAPLWFGGGISVYAAEYETAQAHLYASE